MWGKGISSPVRRGKKRGKRRKVFLPERRKEKPLEIRIGKKGGGKIPSKKRKGDHFFHFPKREYLKRRKGRGKKRGTDTGEKRNLCFFSLHRGKRTF